jgi:hypothetical protein
MSQKIRKTSKGLVAYSLEKAVEAIRVALIDADCNEDVTILLDRDLLFNALTHANKVASDLLKDA